jgi:hypothetical protein
MDEPVVKEHTAAGMDRTVVNEPGSRSLYLMSGWESGCTLGFQRVLKAVPLALDKGTWFMRS